MAPPKSRASDTVGRESLPMTNAAIDTVAPSTPALRPALTPLAGTACYKPAAQTEPRVALCLATLTRHLQREAVTEIFLVSTTSAMLGIDSMADDAISAAASLHRACTFCCLSWAKRAASCSYLALQRQHSPPPLGAGAGALACHRLISCAR
ncbi:hypothetical protein PHYSODRAFT_295166 [Phytophthora sojae]|uniref:Uncharacterized protein n=1 Tax=Phytophthora sojae (strain P6497) TaxID=1094619 RepID=G4YLG4_PHYSP|nr:hypothetical protein PHYSODRAFT_295166 [Phytophthora sojae]EGZ30338.1 hypothetical protein PHYSODRAFT_295166 [Phytophthora sojae]|eukprot:XP_009517613.1 hypothetical protein PHYSODRAFT_295166 [Phytophthora sojae]